MTRQTSQLVQQVRIMDRSYVVPADDTESMRVLLPEGFFAIITDPYQDNVASVSARAAWDYINTVKRLIGD